MPGVDYLNEHQSLDDYSTTEQMNGAIAAYHDNTKADVSTTYSKTEVNSLISGFVTRSVNDLANYYLKSQTYTQNEINQLIAAVKQFRYEVVSTLPTASAQTMGVIYLIPSASQAAQNVKDEFVTIDNGAGAATRYTWEQIGSTTIDLSNYVTVSQLNTALSNYTTTANLTVLLASKQNVIDASHKLSYNLLSDTPTIPTVPTISTDIAADATSDAKTASPKAVKTYVDNAVSGKSKTRIFTDVSAYDWEYDTTYEDFQYRCDIYLQGVTSSMSASVTFALAQAMTGYYAPICEVGNEYVTVYSVTNSPITIPTITVWEE